MKNNINTIEFANLEVDLLVNLISSYKLSPQESSARRRFLRIFNPLMMDLAESRDVARLSHCKRDKEGKPVVIDGKFDYEPKKQKLLNIAWEEINEQKAKVDILPASYDDVKAMVTVLKNEIERFSEKNKEGLTDDQYFYVSTLQAIVDKLSVIR